MWQHTLHIIAVRPARQNTGVVGIAWPGGLNITVSRSQLRIQQQARSMPHALMGIGLTHRSHRGPWKGSELPRGTPRSPGAVARVRRQGGEGQPADQ